MFEDRKIEEFSIRATIAQIEKVVTPFYTALDPWHNMSHASRVVAMAIEINSTEQGDPLLVEAGAWLHQYHAPNLELLDPVLRSLSLSDERATGLRQIVTLCRPDQIRAKPQDISAEVWKAAQIVFDADALDLMGPSGLLREINCNSVTRNKSHAEAIHAAREVQQLFTDSIQTSTGKTMAQKMNLSLEAFWSEYERYEEHMRRSGGAAY
jgi:hypothetical protein